MTPQNRLNIGSIIWRSISGQIKKWFFFAFKLPSTYILIAVNIIPVIGILALGWNGKDIFTLYVLETIILGFFCYLRVIIADRGQRGKWLLFFLVHFTMFSGGIFLILLIVLDPWSNSPKWSSFAKIFPQIKDAVIALAINHIFSFIWNFIYKKESAILGARRELGLTYLRIFLILLLISPLTSFSLSGLANIGIILLILLKTAVDIFIHGAKHYLPPETEIET